MHNPQKKNFFDFQFWLAFYGDNIKKQLALISNCPSKWLSSSHRSATITLIHSSVRKIKSNFQIAAEIK